MTSTRAGQRAEGSQPAQPAVRRKPAARVGRPSESCLGRPDLPCIWHTSQAGAAARPAAGKQRCPLCSQTQMQALHRTTRGKGALALRLKQLLALRSCRAAELWALVEDHLGAEAALYYRCRSASATCLGRADAPCSWHPRQERRCCQSEAEPGRVSLPPLLCSTDAAITSNSAWQARPHLAFQAAPGPPGYQHRPALGSGRGPPRHRRPDILPESCQRSAQEDFKLKLRHSVHPLPDQEGQRVWRERAREDGRMRDKKFGLAFSEQHSGRAWMSARARHFEFWAREASWFMCTDCLEPRPFHQSSHDKNTQLRARQKKCKHCARGIGYKAPSISDIPEVLRDLTADAL